MSVTKRTSLVKQIGWGIAVYLWALVVGPLAMFAHNAWLKWSEAGGFWVLCLVMLVVTYLLGLLTYALRKEIPAGYYMSEDPKVSYDDAVREAKLAAKKDYTWHIIIPCVLNACWSLFIIYDQLS